MGLLDMDMSRPEAQGFNNALLGMAQALLTPQARGGGMGAAFAAFPAAMDRAKQQAMREQLMALQGKQIGLQSDRLGFDMEQARAQQEAARARQAQFAQLVGGLPPDQQGIAQALGPDYFKGLAPQAPKPMEPSGLGRLIAERDKFPEGHPFRSIYDQAIVKLTTHQPAVSVNVGGQKDANWGTPPTNFVWARDAAGNVITEADPETGAYRPKALPVAGGPGEKLPEGQQKQVVGVQNLQNAIKEYRDALATFGTLDAIKPDERAKMGTKYNNMMLQAKEAYNLGVLNGPDFQILTSVITDPRSLTGVITSRDALDKQASELSRIMGTVGSVASTPRPKVRNAPDRSALEAEARRRGLIK